MRIEIPNEITVHVYCSGLQVSQSQETRGKGDKCMFLLYIDASSVTNCKAGTDSASAVGIEFSIKDYYAIQVS